MPAFADRLTLPEALSRARGYDPAQRIATARADAATAGIKQAGVRPNPTLGLDVENFGGHQSGAQAARSETTLYYQQTLERGGKRQARTGLAQRELDLAQAQRIVARMDLFAAVERHWIEAMAAQREAELAETRLKNALAAQGEVMRRVKAARDPLFAGSQVEAEVAEARLCLDQAKSRAHHARLALASYWGGAPDFELDGSLFTVPVLPLATAPDDLPDLAVLEAERDKATARVRLEQTHRAQDISLRGGVRYYAADGGTAFIVGGAIPLGVHDNNRGNIDRAQAERSAMAAELEAKHLQLLRERSRLMAELTLQTQEIRRIDVEVLPPAQRALEQVREGYARGGFRHTDIIDALRSLATIETRKAALLKAAYLHLSDIHRLDGHYADLADLKDHQK